MYQAQMHVTIPMEELRPLAEKAQVAIEKERGLRMNDVLKRHKATKERYQTASWLYRLFHRKPTDHPNDGVVDDVWSDWQDEWQGAILVGFHTRKLCEVILESDLNLPVTLNLYEVNLIKSWAGR